MDQRWLRSIPSPTKIAPAVATSQRRDKACAVLAARLRQRILLDAARMVRAGVANPRPLTLYGDASTELDIAIRHLLDRKGGPSERDIRQLIKRCATGWTASGADVSVAPSLPSPDALPPPLPHPNTAIDCGAQALTPPGLTPLSMSAMEDHTPLARPASATPGSYISAPTMAFALSSKGRRERKLMAEQEWSAAAMEDRAKAAEEAAAARRRKQEKLSNQRGDLDSQVALRKQRKQEEDLEKRTAAKQSEQSMRQYEMFQVRERERRNQRAVAERQMRDAQLRDIQEQRKAAAEAEAEEEARYARRLKDEVDAARASEQARRQRQRAEWRDTVTEHIERDKKLREDRQKESEMDRTYQKLYTEQLDAQERARRAVMEGIQQRAMRNETVLTATLRYRSCNAGDDSVRQTAEERASREQNEMRAREDAMEKMRTERAIAAKREVRTVLDAQVREKRARQKEEMRQGKVERLLIDEQHALAQREEILKRRKARAEMQSRRDFLDTQLQLQFQRESQEIQTSLARPEEGSVRRSVASELRPASAAL